MLYLKIVLHNEINYPVYLEVPIPPELMKAIRFSKITRAEFLFHEKGKDGKLYEPKFAAETDLVDFRDFKNER